jgi:hypothetical protein
LGLRRILGAVQICIEDTITLLMTHLHRPMASLLLPASHSAQLVLSLPLPISKNQPPTVLHLVPLLLVNQAGEDTQAHPQVLSATLVLGMEADLLEAINLAGALPLD